jgi:polar amino acid transport system substrate-binding protein
MKIVLPHLLFLIVVAFTASANLSAQPLRILSTEFSPYSYLKDNELSGLSTDVVLKALDDAEIKYQDIEVYPWSRSYKLAQSSDNSLIFSIARTPQREGLFLWGGKIAPYKVNLYRLRTRNDIQVDSLEMAKSYLSVGEYNDVKWQYLLSQGFEENRNIFTAANPQIALNMLVHKRADLMPFSAFAVTKMLKDNGLNENLLVPVLTLNDISYELYAAFNVNTDPKIVSAFRQSLDNLHQSGWIERRWNAFEAEFLVE